jgi:glycosyltransferase involved in cell wall biosynthesis
VIIPTRDRPELLTDCLESLRADTGEGVEVLVVDDGSSPSAEPIARAAGADCLRMAGDGLNAARNAGAAQAGAPVLAFLDDDVLVRPGWAAAMMESVGEGAAGAGGRITLAMAGPAPPWLRPSLRGYLSEYDLGPSARWIANDEPVPVGANCAVTRAAFEQAGGFRAGLDRVGASLLSSGDTDFFRRVRAAGGRLRYAPVAHVEHRIGPDRLTVSYFRRRAFAQGQSDRMTGEPDPAWRVVGRPARMAMLLAGGLARGHGTVPAQLFLEYRRGRRASA